MGFWDTLTEIFTSGNKNNGPFDYSGGEAGGPEYNVGSEGDSPWFDLGSSILKSLIGPAIGAGIGVAGNALFPGQGPQIIGTDPRSQEMTEAERLRLSSGNIAAKRYHALSTGDYSGIEDELGRVKAGSRNADAARGAFRTGGSKLREQDAVSRYVAQARAQAGQEAGTFTSGYQPKTISNVPAQPSPWSKIIESLGGHVGKVITKKTGGEEWW